MIQCTRVYNIAINQTKIRKSPPPPPPPTTKQINIQYVQNRNLPRNACCVLFAFVSAHVPCVFFLFTCTSTTCFFSYVLRVSLFIFCSCYCTSLFVSACATCLFVSACATCLVVSARRVYLFPPVPHISRWASDSSISNIILTSTVIILCFISQKFKFLSKIFIRVYIYVYNILSIYLHKTFICKHIQYFIHPFTLFFKAYYSLPFSSKYFKSFMPSLCNFAEETR